MMTTLWWMDLTGCAKVICIMTGQIRKKRVKIITILNLYLFMFSFRYLLVFIAFPLYHGYLSPWLTPLSISLYPPLSLYLYLSHTENLCPADWDKIIASTKISLSITLYFSLCLSISLSRSHCPWILSLTHTFTHTHYISLSHTH